MGHQGVIWGISPCQKYPCLKSDARRGPRHVPVGRGEGAVVSTCMQGEQWCSTRSSARTSCAAARLRTSEMGPMQSTKLIWSRYAQRQVFEGATAANSRAEPLSRDFSPDEGGHQASSGCHQGFFSHQGVIRGHQGVIKGSSSGHQGVISGSSRSHQGSSGVIRGDFSPKCSPAPLMPTTSASSGLPLGSRLMSWT